MPKGLLSSSVSINHPYHSMLYSRPKQQFLIKEKLESNCAVYHKLLVPRFLFVLNEVLL
jgi:hypothetical protein